MKILYLAKLPKSIEDNAYSSTKYPWNFFGFYELIRLGNDVYWYTHSREGHLYRFLKRYIKTIDSFYFQVTCLNIVNKFDLIYIGDDVHLFILAIFRFLRIIRKPIFCISHFTYNSKYVFDWKKKFILRIERHLVFRCIDKICFASEKLLQLAKDEGGVPVKHQDVAYWGANRDFYDVKIYADKKPSSDFFLATGGTNRDYETLVKAFSNSHDLNLQLNAKFNSYKKELPPNVCVSDNIKFEIKDFEEQRKQMYNCIAVLLPIKEINHVPNGATVMVEALAMGKPIIISKIDTNYIDVEKEGVGLTVDIGDVYGWQNALYWMKSHPDQVKEMGRKSLLLANKYNVRKFGEVINTQMQKLLKR